jgi:hypothetical protein
MTRVGLVVVMMLGTAATATAQTTATATTIRASARATPGRDWHIGLNMRSDLGVHYFRFDTGVRFGRVDLVAVIDPYLPSNRADLDLLVKVRVAPELAVLVGERTSALGMADGLRYHENLLLGLTTPLPHIGRMRGELGGEMATIWLKHGADLPTYSLLERGHFSEATTFSLFVRIEFASSF